MSMGLSLLRDFALSVPLAVFLAITFGVEGPLFSAPIADGVTFLVMLIIMKHVLRELDNMTRWEPLKKSQKKAAVSQ